MVFMPPVQGKISVRPNKARQPTPESDPGAYGGSLQGRRS
jgi:hypothetical protein